VRPHALGALAFHHAPPARLQASQQLASDRRWDPLPLCLQHVGLGGCRAPLRIPYQPALPSMSRSDSFSSQLADENARLRAQMESR
jgi:hypothetical protein